MEDNLGNSVQEKDIFPLMKYSSDSVEKTLSTIFPRYFGYSVSDIVDWCKYGGALSTRLEWGAVWRILNEREKRGKYI